MLNLTMHIFPILRGDGSEDSFIEIKERQTPQEITKFINDNMGESGKRYFQPISGNGSGIFGGTGTTTANIWSLINNPDDET